MTMSLCKVSSTEAEGLRGRGEQGSDEAGGRDGLECKTGYPGKKIVSVETPQQEVGLSGERAGEGGKVADGAAQGEGEDFGADHEACWTCSRGVRVEEPGEDDKTRGVDSIIPFLQEDEGVDVEEGRSHREEREEEESSRILLMSYLSSACSSSSPSSSVNRHFPLTSPSVARASRLQPFQHRRNGSNDEKLSRSLLSSFVPGPEVSFCRKEDDRQKPRSDRNQADGRLVSLSSFGSDIHRPRRFSLDKEGAGIPCPPHTTSEEEDVEIDCFSSLTNDGGKPSTQSRLSSSPPSLLPLSLSSPASPSASFLSVPSSPSSSCSPAEGAVRREVAEGGLGVRSCASSSFSFPLVENEESLAGRQGRRKNESVTPGRNGGVAERRGGEGGGHHGDDSDDSQELRALDGSSSPRSCPFALSASLHSLDKHAGRASRRHRRRHHHSSGIVVGEEEESGGDYQESSLTTMTRSRSIPVVTSTTSATDSTGSPPPRKKYLLERHTEGKIKADAFTEGEEAEREGAEWHRRRLLHPWQGLRDESTSLVSSSSFWSLPENMDVSLERLVSASSVPAQRRDLEGVCRDVDANHPDFSPHPTMTVDRPPGESHPSQLPSSSSSPSHLLPLSRESSGRSPAVASSGMSSIPSWSEAPVMTSAPEVPAETSTATTATPVVVRRRHRIGRTSCLETRDVGGPLGDLKVFSSSSTSFLSSSPSSITTASTATSSPYSIHVRPPPSSPPPPRPSPPVTLHHQYRNDEAEDPSSSSPLSCCFLSSHPREIPPGGQSHLDVRAEGSVLSSSALRRFDASKKKRTPRRRRSSSDGYEDGLGIGRRERSAKRRSRDEGETDVSFSSLSSEPDISMTNRECMCPSLSPLPLTSIFLSSSVREASSSSYTRNGSLPRSISDTGGGVIRQDASASLRCSQVGGFLSSTSVSAASCLPLPCSFRRTSSSASSPPSQITSTRGRLLSDGEEDDQQQGARRVVRRKGEKEDERTPRESRRAVEEGAVVDDEGAVHMVVERAEEEARGIARDLEEDMRSEHGRIRKEGEASSSSSSSSFSSSSPPHLPDLDPQDRQKSHPSIRCPQGDCYSSCSDPVPHSRTHQPLSTSAMISADLSRLFSSSCVVLPDHTSQELGQVDDQQDQHEAPQGGCLSPRYHSGTEGGCLNFFSSPLPSSSPYASSSLSAASASSSLLPLLPEFDMSMPSRVEVVPGALREGGCQQEVSGSDGFWWSIPGEASCAEGCGGLPMSATGRRTPSASPVKQLPVMDSTEAYYQRSRSLRSRCSHQQPDDVHGCRKAAPGNSKKSSDGASRSPSTPQPFSSSRTALSSSFPSPLLVSSEHHGARHGARGGRLLHGPPYRRRQEADPSEVQGAKEAGRGAEEKKESTQDSISFSSLSPSRNCLARGDAPLSPRDLSPDVLSSGVISSSQPASSLASLGGKRSRVSSEAGDDIHLSEAAPDHSDSQGPPPPLTSSSASCTVGRRRADLTISPPTMMGSSDRTPACRECHADDRGEGSVSRTRHHCVDDGEGRKGERQEEEERQRGLVSPASSFSFPMSPTFINHLLDDEEDLLPNQNLSTAVERRKRTGSASSSSSERAPAVSVGPMATTMTPRSSPRSVMMRSSWRQAEEERKEDAGGNRPKEEASHDQVEKSGEAGEEEGKGEGEESGRTQGQLLPLLSDASSMTSLSTVSSSASIWSRGVSCIPRGKSIMSCIDFLNVFSSHPSSSSSPSAGGRLSFLGRRRDEDAMATPFASSSFFSPSNADISFSFLNSRPSGLLAWERSMLLYQAEGWRQISSSEVLMVRLCSFLDARDLIHLASTCRQLRGFAMHWRVWRKLCLGVWGGGGRGGRQQRRADEEEDGDEEEGEGLESVMEEGGEKQEEEEGREEHGAEEVVMRDAGCDRGVDAVSIEPEENHREEKIEKSKEGEERSREKDFEDCREKEKFEKRFRAAVWKSLSTQGEDEEDRVEMALLRIREDQEKKRKGEHGREKGSEEEDGRRAEPSLTRVKKTKEHRKNKKKICLFWMNAEAYNHDYYRLYRDGNGWFPQSTGCRSQGTIDEKKTTATCEAGGESTDDRNGRGGQERLGVIGENRRRIFGQYQNHMKGEKREEERERGEYVGGSYGRPNFRTAKMQLNPAFYNSMDLRYIYGDMSIRTLTRVCVYVQLRVGTFVRTRL